jgi:ABC-type siderophore export system fused ATPase/permease subunit
MNSQFSDMMTMFWVFNKHWAAMSEANKQQIWKYLKSLVLLARRVPAARQHPLLF